MTRSLLLGALCLGFAACKPPLHMQYDFGRAFTQTMALQADLTRPTVALETYQMYGVEAVKIRLNVETTTTAQESGDTSFQ